MFDMTISKTIEDVSQTDLWVYISRENSVPQETLESFSHGIRNRDISSFSNPFFLTTIKAV